MKFLANQNFPRPSIIAIRERGYEVVSVSEKYPGITDESIISIASQHDLIILTFDKDYGEIIFKYSKVNPPAVVFFREKGDSPQFAGQTLLSILHSSSIRIVNCFTVIEKDRIRQRQY